jgi:TonB family C-terminal domain/TonB family C-terminal domain
MHPFFIYLIQVNIALALFYLLYTIVLKKDTFLHVRRFFFLSVIVFSLFYPLFYIPALGDMWVLRFSGTHEVEATVVVGKPRMTMIVEEAEVPLLPIPWAEMLSLLYVSVTFAFALRLACQLISIFRIRTKSDKRIVSGIPVYQLSDDIPPFSFFNLIFVHTEKHSETELDQILLHEQTHAHQWHSIDIMLIELLSVFFWWNPFVWLIKREMTMNIEYLADNGVLREGVNSREYQYHLLRLTYNNTAVPIVNNFNVPQLKQRIMMMNKTKTPAYKLGRYLLMLPLIFLLILANSCVNQEKKSQEGIATENAASASDSIDNLDNLGSDLFERDKDKIYEVVENPPEFPGGNEGLMKFLSENTKYPVVAQENGIQGRVICQFIVMKDGTIEDVRVARGVDPSLDTEAVRVLRQMPEWKPGMQSGQAVNVRFTLPVVFKLTKDDPTDAEKEAFQKSVENIQSPEYPGGESAYFKFLAENIRYPVIAQENGIQGLVEAVFNINSQGKVTFVRIEKGVDPSLDKEVQRVIELMPDWTPGKINGEATSTTTGVPFIFRLQGDDAAKSYKGPTPENAIVVVGYSVGKKLTEIKDPR